MLHSTVLSSMALGVVGMEVQVWLSVRQRGTGPRLIWLSMKGLQSVWRDLQRVQCKAQALRCEGAVWRVCDE